MILVSCLRLQVCPFAVLAFLLVSQTDFPPSLISVLASLSDLLFLIMISSFLYLLLLSILKKNLSIFFPSILNDNLEWVARVSWVAEFSFRDC